MKNQKYLSIKGLKIALLMVVILTISGCVRNQEYSNQEEKLTKSSQSKPMPLRMDIHTAALMGNLDVINQHIEARSNLDAKDPNLNSSPLITAAIFGKTDVARALIEAGADVNFKNKEGSTPLHCAAFFCHIEIVEVLLENGAEKSLKNNFGSTALEAVAGSFDNVKGLYDQFSKDLGPMGFELDIAQVERTRPRIAKMLQ